MSEQDQSPKLHVDTDWKAQAQAEKERLAAQESQRSQEKQGAGPDGQPGQMPEPSFQTLMGILATQALMGLGAFADKKSGGVAVDLEGARFNIDLLDVLAKKTEGNLTEDEKNELTQILHELRSRYVYIAELVAKQMQSSGQMSGLENPVAPTDWSSAIPPTSGPIQP